MISSWEGIERSKGKQDQLKRKLGEESGKKKELKVLLTSLRETNRRKSQNLEDEASDLRSRLERRRSYSREKSHFILSPSKSLECSS